MWVRVGLAIRVGYVIRPVGRGGSRGFGRTPLLASKRSHMHRLTVILSALPFEIGPLASMLLRITAVKTIVVAAMRVRSWRTSAERSRKLFTPLGCKDARKYVRK